MFCRTGELAGVDFEIGAEAVIGRGGTSTIVLPTGVVSQQHARVSCEPVTARYFLEDLGSRNGTRLDGVAVHRRTRLTELHVITFAERHDFIFQVIRQGAPAPDAGVQSETRFGPPTAPRLPAGLVPAPEPDVPSGQTSFRPGDPIRLPDFGQSPGAGPVAGTERGLALDVPDEGGRRLVDLADGSYEVGRSPECRICLTDRTLSRRHVRLDVGGGRVTVTDLGSENGTFIDGVRVTGSMAAGPGAEITLGKFVQVRLVRKTV
ncbi:MAG TPA: FHA domain-containing protein [Planctomycetaceae bacterium]|nr:FHA domain-containing protein [Planctomycetaceae bacterium]